MSETGIKQLNSRTSSQSFTEQHRNRARQIQNIASSITLYAEGYGVPTEITLEMLRYPGTRQVHSTDKFYGWKLGAEGTKPNSDPDYKEGVALLLSRGVQFFVFREPIEEGVPLYKPEGFNLTDLAADEKPTKENELRVAADNQALIDRMIYGRFSGYDALMESLLDFADQHEIIVPPVG